MSVKNNSTGKFYIKAGSDAYADITTKFEGVAVLSVEGFNEKGEAQNVFTQKWINSSTEDFCIVGSTIIRANVDLKMTFIVSRRYTNTVIDEQTVYDTFTNYICGSDFYIKSLYSGKEAHVVCQKGVKLSSQKLQRGEKSYIMATAELHTLDVPQTVVQQQQQQQGGQA